MSDSWDKLVAENKTLYDTYYHLELRLRVTAFLDRGLWSVEKVNLFESQVSTTKWKTRGFCLPEITSYYLGILTGRVLCLD